MVRPNALTRVTILVTRTDGLVREQQFTASVDLPELSETQAEWLGVALRLHINEELALIQVLEVK